MYIYVFMYLCIYVFMSLCMCGYIDVDISVLYLCVYFCVCVYKYLCVCVLNVCVCWHVYIYIYISEDVNNKAIEWKMKAAYLNEIKMNIYMIPGQLLTLRTCNFDLYYKGIYFSVYVYVSRFMCVCLSRYRCIYIPPLFISVCITSSVYVYVSMCLGICV